MNKLDTYKKELVKVLASIKDEATMNDFLVDLLTGAEIEELPKRLQIIKQLDKGVSQREVAKNLGVGIATVTRGAKELKNKKGGFRKVLDIMFGR
ncbi:MAG TPA: transcriptional regulator [Candidatus Magasanikbacteria bacterium]|nr:transcriptional regulator [Candidatus Magasanikbacteria bacterium]